MQDETSAIEEKYDELDKKFNIQKVSLEKEIIRRKYVEDLARVGPKTYKPTGLLDFMKELETDHTDYLNRIKNTYKDAGLVCQACDKQRKIDPNSPRIIRKEAGFRETSDQGASAAAAPSQETNSQHLMGNKEQLNKGESHVTSTGVGAAAVPNIENIRPQVCH